MQRKFDSEAELDAAVSRVAGRPDTVLITGPTGSGKSFTARQIHLRSARQGKAFVVVDCGALPPTLVTSELFGTTRSAYTGAEQRIGQLAAADGGTLFLDEIANLPLEGQAKLLVVLEERRFKRLGSTVEESPDFRLLVATNRDLVDRARQGLFLLDLYYRINVLRLEIPALRERRELLASITEQAIEAEKKDHAWVERVRSILRRLAEHPRAWPGSVRELNGFIKRCALSDPDESARLLIEEWQRLAPTPDGAELTKIGPIQSPSLDDRNRYASLIRRCLSGGGATGRRPATAAAREVTQRLASRLLDAADRTLSRDELAEILEARAARTVSTNLELLSGHGLVEVRGDRIAARWPPAETTLLLQRGGGWQPALLGGATYATTGDRIRLEVRTRWEADLRVLMITHSPGEAPFEKQVVPGRRLSEEQLAAVEIVLEAPTGLEQILVHLAPADRRSGAAVEAGFEEPIMPSSSTLEEGRRRARSLWGDGWLAEHFVFQGAAPAS